MSPVSYTHLDVYKRQDDDDNPAERQVAEESLQDHLRWQLGLTTLSDRDQELGLALIDAIRCV